MPTVEIDEAEHARNETLRATIQKMFANPKAAVLMERAAKEIDPHAKTPHLDAESAREQPYTELSKKMDEFLKAQGEKEAEREKRERMAELNSRWEKGRDKLRAKGITAEGIGEIEKLMESKGIVDHTDGLTLFERDHPPPPPEMPMNFGSWNFFETKEKAGEGDQAIKDLIASRGESESATRKMVNAALAEVRQR